MRDIEGNCSAILFVELIVDKAAYVLKCMALTRPVCSDKDRMI